mmetsp:Transcript_12543/g.18766  ORF Transcript_12543/g.18766 Transcript_12543/m.18766 type:complete len:84 (-) Transcript_12543:150-401(-)
MQCCKVALSAAMRPESWSATYTSTSLFPRGRSPEPAEALLAKSMLLEEHRMSLEGRERRLLSVLPTKPKTRQAGRRKSTPRKI